MRLCGWETRSMFDHCNIIDEAGLAAAVRQAVLRQTYSKL